MGRRSVAARTAGEISRKRLGKSTMGSIYRHKAFSRYPECSGSMAGCPGIIENPVSPPETCAKCPNFLESSFYKKPSPEEKIQELRNLFEEFRKK